MAKRKVKKESVLESVINRIKGEENRDSDVLLNEMLDRYWNVASTARKELDWKWFNYDLWVSGNHYAKWEKNTQQITTSPRSDGKPKIVINKTFTTIRAVRSYVLQNRPKAEVTPFDMTDQDVDQAVTLSQYLDYLHDHLHLGQSLRASMWHALKYSVGFWEILWNDELEDGQGGVEVNVVDPYDLYWDPVARFPAEARFVVLAVRRNIADLKEDPKYKDADWDKIVADKQFSSSSLKSRLLQYERGEIMIGDTKKDDGTVIVKEFWYKEHVDEEDAQESLDNSDSDITEQSDTTVADAKRGDKDSDTDTPGDNVDIQSDKQSEEPGSTKYKKTKIMLCAKIGEVMIRKPIDTGLDRFPFFRVCSDIEPLNMYGTGWCKHLIPANRLLERLESSAAEYNDIVNKGRYRVDKGAGYRQVTNEHGIIIETKRGFNFEALPVAPIDGQMIMGQIVNANKYIEDLGSWHDASMGRASSADQSGRSIEALQEGDSNNLSELIENTEEFLQDAYEYILKLSAEKMQASRNVTTSTQTSERVYMKLVGEKAANEIKQQQGITVIPSKNVVKVSIVSNLAYTADGRRQAMKDLVTLMPQLAQAYPQAVLEAYSIGPIADITKAILQWQTQQQKQAQMEQQMQQQQQQQAQAQQIQQQAQIQQQQQPQGAPQAGAREAIAFIRLLLGGGRPTLPQNIGPEFINYMTKFISSGEAKHEIPGDVLSVLEQIKDQAMLHMKEGMIGDGGQVASVA